MKAFIDADEHYPVFTITSSRFWNEIEIEISEELFEKFSEIQSQYDWMQDTLRELYDKGRK